MKNPFSAEHPVIPVNFAGRRDQLQEFKRFLNDTIEGNSKNLAVLGSWGIGKTSILRMFRHIAMDAGCIATIIELGEATDSFISLFELIVQSLARDAAHVKTLDSRVRDLLETLSFSVQYGPIGISIAERKRANPNIMKFKDDLVSIHRQTKVPYLVMLDNAEYLLRMRGAIFELRNIFQTLQSLDGTPSMLILSGKETLFSDIHSASEPAVRFFWGIELGPFILQETREAIERPLIGTSVKFTEDCVQAIHTLSCGHPYFVQVFAYHLFSLRTSDKITTSDLEHNYPSLMNYLGKRLFGSLYANLSATEREVMGAFSLSDKDVLTNTEIGFLCKVKSVNKHLKVLSELPHPVLSRRERGKYSLFHPLFKEYMRTVTKQ